MYPVVITYIRTADKGQELRYALRSLKNIQNWNGEVFVVGDKEDWFTNLIHIPHRRQYGSPYLDQVNKVRQVCLDDRVADDFILTMDDVYIMEKTNVSAYCRGFLTGSRTNSYQRTKIATAEFIKEELGITALDYETHAPIVFNKYRFLEIAKLIYQSRKKTLLQMRSIYGSVFELEEYAEYFEDKKGRTHKLPEGKIISTSFYTSELNNFFPEKSEFEK